MSHEHAPRRGPVHTGLQADHPSEDAQVPSRRPFELPLGYLQYYGIAPKSAPSASESFAAATRGGGTEVPYRAAMEQAFNADFAGVSAHLGRGEDLAALGARAAAQGEQVAFGTTSPDRELVAHELAHVVQSRKAGGQAVQRAAVVSNSRGAAEVEAQLIAPRAAAGERVIIRQAPEADIHCDFEAPAADLAALKSGYQGAHQWAWGVRAHPDHDNADGLNSKAAHLQRWVKNLRGEQARLTKLYTDAGQPLADEITGATWFLDNIEQEQIPAIHALTQAKGGGGGGQTGPQPQPADAGAPVPAPTDSGAPSAGAPAPAPASQPDSGGGNQTSPSPQPDSGGGNQTSPSPQPDSSGGTADADVDARTEAGFQQRGLAVLDKIPQALTQGGQAPRVAGQSDATSSGALPGWVNKLQHALLLSTTWGPEQQEGQAVLQEYAAWMLKKKGDKIPPNVQVFLRHLGESPRNAGKNQGDRLPSGPNSCTAVTTTATKEALGTDKLPKVASLWGAGAYTAPLHPGDMVMFLFDRCQYGGHTVTVAQDLGDSFLHVSGNSTAGGVGMSESQRLKSPPAGFSLAKATTVDTEEHRKAASDHLDSIKFGGKVLVYSIVRNSALFQKKDDAGGAGTPSP